MKKTKCIIFDIDGTLTDTVNLHHAAFTHSLEKMGVHNIDTNYNTYKHHTDSYIAKINYEKNSTDSFNEKKISEFENILLKHIEKNTEIHEIRGAKDTITYLENDTDYAIAFATGSLRKPAEYKLKEIGISFNRNQLVASNTLFERKSIVERAINNAKKYYKSDQFDRIISIGDGIWDLQTAQHLGLEFIGIGTKNKIDLIKHGCQIHFKDFCKFRLK